MPQPVNRPTAVSLFAGIGGIDLALQRAGFDVVAAVEIDRAARGVLTDRFPDATLYTDVTKVTADDLRTAGFVADRGLIAAGWPCQDNSTAGSRKGMAGERSGLWREVARIVAETHPRWLLGENVPGLLSVNGGHDFAAILWDLAQLRMAGAWRVLDAQHFGVPQRRRRVFLVGHFGTDHSAPVQILFDTESGDGDSAPSGTAGPRATAFTASSAGSGCGADVDDATGNRLAVPTLAVAGTLQTRRGGGLSADEAGAGHLVPYSVTRTLTAIGAGATYDEQQSSGQLIPFDLAQITPRTAPTRRLAGPPPCLAANGKPHVANALTSDGGSGGRRQEDDRNAVAHTLTSAGCDASEDGSGGGTPLVPSAFGVRRLTPTECERLQGLPDGWTATSNGKPQADSPRYHQIGNSVAVPVVQWLAARIIAYESGALSRNQKTPGAASPGVLVRTPVLSEGG